MGANKLKKMINQQKLYDISPYFLQRILVNIEAWKRDWFRRYDNYRMEQIYYDPTWNAQDSTIQEAYQVERLCALVQKARRCVPFYRRALPDITTATLKDILRLPILEKSDVRKNPLAFVQEGVARAELWHSITSGSTGNPLHFYHDRSITRAHQAISDACMAMYGCTFGERRVRFSGVYIAPYTQTKPPFWIYIDHYKQLQCSVYHLGPHTYHYYLQAMRDAKVNYGTGYASTWHLMATYILDSGKSPPALKAIFTDSEGVDLEQQATIERAFGCPVFQTYGTGEVGQVAIQCTQRRYHVLSRACIAEILNENDEPVQPGEIGQIIITDLTGFVTPFIRYRTGDLATLASDACTCGWHSPSWTTIVGRMDDQIKTPDGRWVRIGGHIIRPAVGVRESQIFQTAINQIVIRVVPDSNFEPNSMDAVLAAAYQYLGSSMNITWEVVDRLERTASGKLRHIVRKIEV